MARLHMRAWTWGYPRRLGYSGTSAARASSPSRSHPRLRGAGGRGINRKYPHYIGHCSPSEVTQEAHMPVVSPRVLEAALKSEGWARQCGLKRPNRKFAGRSHPAAGQLAVYDDQRGRWLVAVSKVVMIILTCWIRRLAHLQQSPPLWSHP